MESLDVIVFHGDDGFDKIFVSDYLIALNTHQGGNKDWSKITSLVGANTLELLQTPATGILTKAGSPDYRITVPSALNYGIRRYDMKKEKEKSKGGIGAGRELWMSEKDFESLMLTDSNNQKIKAGVDFTGRRVQIQLQQTDVLIHPRMLETLSIITVGVGKKGCDHTRSDVMYERVYQGDLHIMAGTCFDIDQSIQLNIIGEVGVNRHERQLALGGVQRVGDKIFTKRFQTADQQKVLHMTVASNLYPEKAALYDGQRGASVKVKEGFELDAESRALDEIAIEWKRHPTGARTSDILRLCTRKGKREGYTDPQGAERLHARLLQNFSRFLGANTQEIRNIRAEDKSDGEIFAATLMVITSDSMERTIWSEEKYSVLRGIYLYCREKLGPIYYTLRKDFRWRIRDRYTDRTKCWNVCDQRQYFMNRYNYYDLRLEAGNTIYKWKVEKIEQEAKTNQDEGYPYKKFDGEEEDDPDVIVHSIDAEKYNTFMQRIINNGWQEKDGIGQIMEERSGIENFYFTKDAYIDDRGFLVLPPYYDKKIKSTLYQSSFHVRRVTITSPGTEDPWVIKTADKEISEERTWLLPLDHIVDTVPCLRGQGLSDVEQQTSGRFNEIINDIKKDEQLKAFFPDEINEEDYCPAKTVLKYVSLRKRIHVFSVLKWFMPVERLREFIGSDDYEYVGEDHTQVFQLEQEIERRHSYTSIVLYVIELGYERIVNMYTDEQIRVLQEILRSNEEGSRNDWIQKNLPCFYECFKKVPLAKKVEDVVPLVLYQALVLSTYPRAANQNKSHPLFLFEKDKLRIVPINTSNQRGDYELMRGLYIMRFHYGFKARRNDLEADLLSVIKKVWEYWERLSSDPVALDDARRIRKELIKAHIYGYCGIIQTAATFVLPITSPKKGFIVLAISQDIVKLADLQNVIRAQYHDIANYIIGICGVTLGRQGHMEAIMCENIQGRQLKKVVLGHKMELLHIKFPGRVFENHEIITKLVN
uniref:Outer capsid protein VP2 n=1 Tax=Epizootic hemorrhagic disease virus (serotype 4 / strain IbAr 33853) TaxID=449136 RepID=C8TE95_9REOV|nr:VP2 protein [Epizootic hemorrhagic disease virus (serotype 4 / strain IbAr 33853)]